MAPTHRTALDGSCRPDVSLPRVLLGLLELGLEEVVSGIERLLDEGENEQVLILFLQDIAQLTPEELDAVRSTPIWGGMEDAARTVPRELQAIHEYEFDASRVVDMATPTSILSGGESPPSFNDATDAVTAGLSNGRLVTFDGEVHEPVNTAPDRCIDQVSTYIRETNE